MLSMETRLAKDNLTKLVIAGDVKDGKERS